MAKTYKILGQVLPGTANTETTLYTVPGSAQAVISTISVANTTTSAATYRINVRPAGAAVAAVHALARDISLSGNSTATLTLGVTLAATDVVSVQTSAASAVAFHAYGTEIV